MKKMFLIILIMTATSVLAQKVGEYSLQNTEESLPKHKYKIFLDQHYLFIEVISNEAIVRTENLLLFNGDLKYFIRYFEDAKLKYIVLNQENLNSNSKIKKISGLHTIKAKVYVTKTETLGFKFDFYYDDLKKQLIVKSNSKKYYPIQNTMKAKTISFSIVFSNEEEVNNFIDLLKKAEKMLSKR